MRKYWIKIVIIGALIVAAFLIIRQLQAGNIAKKVIAYTVKRQDLSDILSLSGHIDASEHAVMRFQTSGQIAWVGVKEGDTVAKYQSLASLDQQILKKQLQKYLNTYLKTRDTFDQNKDTYKDQVVTDAIKRIGDQAQQDLNNSVIDVQLQDLTIRFSNLWTPIEGIVTRVDSPVAGVNISVPTQAEFEVINPQTIYFSSVADQTDVVNLKVGLTGNLVLDAYPGQKISGTIIQIGFLPKPGEAGTVYEVKVRFNKENNSYQYRFGMTGDINFVLKEKKDVLSLPKNLVKEEQGQKFVYLHQRNKTTRKNVVIGETIDNQVEITLGLSELDVVVNQP